VNFGQILDISYTEVSFPSLFITEVRTAIKTKNKKTKNKIIKYKGQKHI
jgi:hypothetical protein